MNFVRVTLIFFAAVLATGVARAQLWGGPSDGAGLLDYEISSIGLDFENCPLHTFTPNF